MCRTRDLERLHVEGWVHGLRGGPRRHALGLPDVVLPEEELPVQVRDLLSLSPCLTDTLSHDRRKHFCSEDAQTEAGFDFVSLCSDCIPVVSHCFRILFPHICSSL